MLYNIEIFEYLHVLIEPPNSLIFPHFAFSTMPFDPMRDAQ